MKTLVIRGEQVESRHRACAVVAPRIGAMQVLGPPDPGTFLRSVAKPFQSLAILSAGVVDTFSLTDAEIAVTAASHAGERVHHERVEGLLRRGGFGPEDLDCGIHPPFAATERHRRLRDRDPFSPLGNNCSGKHAGMLLLARHLGVDPARYREPLHPVQVHIRGLLEEFSGVPLATETWGEDGCGVPTYYLPLTAIARAFHRLGDEHFLDARGYREARDRLHRSLFAYPREASGEGRLPFRLSPVLRPGFLSKEGAEGVYAIWGAAGALVVKSLDGGDRGYRWVLPELLGRFGWLGPEALRRWRDIDPPVVRNVAGRAVGRVVIEASSESEGLPAPRELN